MTRRIAMTFPLFLGTPGGGTHDCFELARHLARAGVELTLLTSRSRGPARFPRGDSQALPEDEARRRDLEAEGIRLRTVPGHPLHYLLDGRPMRRAVRELLAGGSFDALIGWWHEAAFLPGVAQAAGVPFAMIAAASYGPILAPNGRRERLRQLFRATCLTRGPLRAARRVFVRSEFSKRELVELAGVQRDRVRVAPCGVDSDLARIPRPESEIAQSVQNLLYFGRFVAQKGIFDAIAAFGQILRREPRPLTLRIAGWGDEGRVRRLASEHGVAEHIELLGALDRAGLERELGRAEVALLPSFTESFGLANAEALMAGIPVVAYAAGAVPEVVEQGVTGWLARTGDVAALGAALESALQDPSATRRAGLAGRARMLERFTWARAAELTMAGLEEVWADGERRWEESSA